MQFKLFELLEDKEDINQVMKELSTTCTSCRLSTLHPDNRGVIWRGSLSARIAVIGEAPGDKETERGAPLVGPSGQEWERWASIMRINTAKDCFITNVAQCFTGDSVIQASDVSKLYRREYNGELITVKTSRGEITGTPNHPVLTQRGWVSLNKLDLRDSLIYCGVSELIVLTKPQVAYRPTKAVQLFSTLSGSGTCTRIVDSCVNFHGDGKDGQVDVVTLDRELMGRTDTSTKKFGLDPQFEATDNTKSAFTKQSSRFSSFMKRFLSFRNSFGSFISSFCNRFSSFQRATSKSNLLSCGVATHGNPSFDKVLLEGMRTSASDLSEGVEALSGLVTLDQIVDISSKLFVGHVYNFHTDCNYYSVNNYIVHNCQPEKTEVNGRMSQRAPDPTELKACFPNRCLRILKALPNLEVVITLGWVAASTLLGEPASTKTHEAQWLVSDLLPGVPIFCLVHPSFLLREPSLEKTKSLEDKLGLFHREYVDPLTSKILDIARENKDRQNEFGI